MKNRLFSRAALLLAPMLGSQLCVRGRGATAAQEKLAVGQVGESKIQNPKPKMPAAPEKLTIRQAIEIALANHPALRDARERVAAAQARVGVAKSRYFPRVSFNGIGKLGLSGATNGLGLTGLPASPFYRNLSDAVNVNQDIFDFGRTRHSVDLARAEAEAAQHDLDSVRIQLAERASETFLKVLSAQQVIRVREQALRERQGVERKAEEFFQAGLSSKLEVDLAQVGLSTAELALSEARNDERVAWVELFTALGGPEGEHYDLVELEFQLVRPAELADEIKQALATRPDLKALEAEIQAQQERVQYARALRRPILSGVWSGGYARFAELTFSRLMVGGLGLFAPLYTGGELEARTKAEERNLEALRAQYSLRVLGVRTEVSRAHADLVKALESAEANRKIAAYGEEALRLARTRYEAQLASFVDLLTAEAATEEARANYARALYDYQIAKVHLDASLGLEPPVGRKQ